MFESWAFNNLLCLGLMQMNKKELTQINTLAKSINMILQTILNKKGGVNIDECLKLNDDLNTIMIDTNKSLAEYDDK